jgi:hypothetical protein
MKMDSCEVESIKDQAEGNAVDFNTTYRVKNKALRRAQVVKDKRRKNKVCNHKACVRRHARWHLIQIFSWVFKNVSLVITTATITELYFVESMKKCMTLGLSRGVNEIFALLVCYTTFIGSYRRFGTIC